MTTAPPNTPVLQRRLVTDTARPVVDPRLCAMCSCQRNSSAYVALCQDCRRYVLHVVMVSGFAPRMHPEMQARVPLDCECLNCNIWKKGCLVKMHNGLDRPVVLTFIGAHPVFCRCPVCMEHPFWRSAAYEYSLLW